MEAPPEILVTGEQRRSATEIEIKVEKESSDFEVWRKDYCEKGKVREILNVRQPGREGRRKSETPQLRRKEESEAGKKAKEGHSRKRDENTRSGDRLMTQGNRGTTDEEERGLRCQKRGSSPNQPAPHSSSLMLGADLDLLRGRQGRRKSEVKMLLVTI